MSLLQKIKAEETEKHSFIPSKNIPFEVKGYDLTSSDEPAILGMMVNDEGQKINVRVVLSEDKDAAKRKKPRAGAKERSDPKNKAHIAIGGWLIAQNAYIVSHGAGTEEDPIQLKARWLETITNGPNKGTGMIRMAHVDFIERKSNNNEFIVVTTFNTEASVKVDNIADVESAIVQQLTPKINSITPTCLIRASEGNKGDAVTFQIKADRIQITGEQYKTIATGQASLDTYKKTSSWKSIKALSEEKQLTLEVIPGAKFNVTNDSKEHFFDNEGKIPAGTENKNSYTGALRDIYQSKNVSGYLGNMYTDTVIGVDMYSPKEGVNIPFLRTFMPLNSVPESVALEYIPTTFYTPEGKSIKQIKKDIKQADDLGMSVDEADNMAVLSELEAGISAMPQP